VYFDKPDFNDNMFTMEFFYNMRTLLNYLTNIPQDKLLHFVVCDVLSTLLHLIFPAWFTFAMVFVIAVIKELYDHVSGKGTADWKDLVADILGIIVGIM
jgi:hypothetical protein